MRIQTFTASTMQEAMDQVRADLGEDAIILSSKQNGGAVHVRAAIEAPIESASDTAPLLDIDIEQKLQTELRRRVENLSMPGANGIDKAPPSPLTAIRLAEVLKFHGISASLALALRRVSLAMDTPDGELALANAIDARINFASIPARPKKPLILAGPPGMGKTSTLAKLMAKSALAGLPVQVVTTDTVRSGAEEQIKASAEITKTPVITAATPEELSTLLQASRETSPDTITLIDTPGVNPFSADDVGILKEIIDASEGELVFVASAGIDGAELTDVAAVFKKMGAAHMIATRLDTARRLGGLLVAVDAACLKLSHVSHSPYVADGLKAANPMSFAKWLLEAPKSMDVTETAVPNQTAQMNG